MESVWELFGQLNEEISLRIPQGFLKNSLDPKHAFQEHPLEITVRTTDNAKTKI